MRKLMMVLMMTVAVLMVGCMGVPKVGGGGDFTVIAQPWSDPVIVLTSPDAMVARETPSMLQHNNANTSSQPQSIGKETQVGRGQAQEGAIAPGAGRDTTSAEAAASGTATTSADASGPNVDVTPVVP